VREPDRSERPYEGDVLAVTVEHWGDAKREIVERADSVAVVATDGEDRLVLVRQPREAARRELVELPAGTIDDDEDPLETAKRELREETGLTGGRWRRGPAVFSTPGFCRERMHLFLAEGLVEGDADPDSGERIEVLRWSAVEVEERLDEIEDAKTLAGMLLYLRVRRP
jgi:ADP-ribose pyrophosphatase